MEARIAFANITRPKAEPRKTLCSARVTARVKAALQQDAASRGVPFSEYISGILTAHAGQIEKG